MMEAPIQESVTGYETPIITFAFVISSQGNAGLALSAHLPVDTGQHADLRHRNGG